MKTHSLKIWTTFALVVCLAPNGLAQHPQDEPEPPGLNPLRPVATPDPQDEMQQLFIEVERRLRAIDALLIDASAGDTAKLSELKESGIEDLIQEASPSASATGVSGVLRASQGQGQRVLSGIDRIIEIAEASGGSCSSPGGQSPEGESPLDKQGEQRTDKTQSPEGPQEGAPQPKPGEGEPKSPEGSKDPGDIKPAQKTPDSEVEAASAIVENREHWGDLPVHHRDIFRAEGGKKLPAQYRDWIDSYYRRLNARAND